MTAPHTLIPTSTSVRPFPVERSPRRERLKRWFVFGVVSLSFVLGGLAVVVSKNVHRTHSAPNVKVATSGAKVRWRADHVELKLDSSLNELGQNVAPAVRDSLDAWKSTGAALPTVELRPGGKLNPGYRPGEQNENAIIYVPKGWKPAHGALAVTVTTFDSDTGTILDSDIVINGGVRPLEVLDPTTKSVGDDSDEVISLNSPVDNENIGNHRFDLQALITHEFGHFFGLGEDHDEREATMFSVLRAEDTSKRSPKPSDREALLSLYEPNETGIQCGMSPRFHATGLMSTMTFLFVILSVSSLRRRRMLLFIVSLLTLSALGLANERINYSLSHHGMAARVVSLKSTMNHGLIETQVDAVIASCVVEKDCDEGKTIMTVIPGGTLGNITQVVGHGPVINVGDKISIIK